MNFTEIIERSSSNIARSTDLMHFASRVCVCTHVCVCACSYIHIFLYWDDYVVIFFLILRFMIILFISFLSTVYNHDGYKSILVQ